MSTSSIGTVLDALRAALVLRAGLAGVNVFSGPVSLDEAGLECIAFGDAKLDEKIMAASGGKLEAWQVEGTLRVAKSWQGTTETTIKAARDRALAIFAELETHVNDTYTGSLPDVEVTSGDLAQEFDGGERVCWLSFMLTMRDDKNP